MNELGPFSQGKVKFKDNDIVCFCFGYTRNQIEEDFVDNGWSVILEKIENAKKSDGCDCARKNPKGR